MSHSPEPWSVESWDGTSSTVIIVDDQAEVVLSVDVHPNDGPKLGNNVRRIVACVNACQGIPNEYLEFIASKAAKRILHKMWCEWLETAYTAHASMCQPD